MPPAALGHYPWPAEEGETMGSISMKGAVGAHGGPAHQQRPVVLVAAPVQALSEVLGACCAFIGARLESLRLDDLNQTLQCEEPIAVVAMLGDHDPDGYEIVDAIADADARLPVLIVTGENDRGERVTDAEAARRGLRHARVSAGIPEPATLIGFLVEAGIRRGWIGFMPS
jgi:hypothetical protein